ncbi:MAG TPA: acetyltransferase [Candidatus Obscuribacterales bacterium]
MTVSGGSGIVIIGAGGHGKVVLDAILKEGRFQVLSFVDEAGAEGDSFCGLPVSPTMDGFVEPWFVVAVGDNRARRRLFLQARERGWRAAAIIHPSAIIAGDVTIGGGTVVLAGVVVNPATVIDTNCIINTAATIDHDCVISSDVHVAPGCRLAGEVTIGQGTFLGIGTIVIPRIKIGSWATAGAGSVVVGAVEDNCTVMGVPARVKSKVER